MCVSIVEIWIICINNFIIIIIIIIIIMMLTLMNGISTHFNQSKKWTQKRIQTHSHLILTKKSIVCLIFLRRKINIKRVKVVGFEIFSFFINNFIIFS